MRKMTTAGLAAPAALLLGLVFLAGPAFGQPGEVVSVAERDFVAARLGGRGVDLLMRRAGRVYIVASPGELAALSALGIDWTAETARLQKASLEGLSADGGINGAYHSALELETDLRTLERDHPGLARVVELGRSLEGRPVLALKISDNAASSEGEPALLVLGCHHAREWISVEVPYQFGRYLLDNYDLDAQVRALVDASEIWIVPMVNPDGLEYSIHVYRYWRKNRRANADGTFGVDVNRNYGFAWGYDNDGSSGYPGSEVYRGTSAFSEPETAAVRDLFTDAASDFRGLVSLHSYGQDILYPWGYTTAPAPDSAALGSLAGTMAGLIAAVRGTAYTYGQASTALYLTNGDTVDWAYSLRGAPAFTIELPPVDVDHGGFFNDEAAIGAVFQETLPALLDLARYAVDHPLPVRPPLRPDGRRDRTSRPAGAKARPSLRPAPGTIR
jgi:carboxypeptidase T